MNKKRLFLVILLCFSLSFVYSETSSSSLNWLSRQHADSIYPQLGGDAYFNNLEIRGNITNATIINATYYNVLCDIYGNCYTLAELNDTPDLWVNSTGDIMTGNLTINVVGIEDDVELRLISELNKHSYLYFMENDLFGFRLWYDGSGSNQFKFDAIDNGIIKPQIWFDRDTGEIDFFTNLDITDYNMTADYFYGSGAFLRDLNVTGNVSVDGDLDMTGYVLTTSYLNGVTGGIDMRGDPWYFSGSDLQIAEDLIVDGNVTANYFKGDGSLLDNLPSADLSSYLQNGTDAEFGTVNSTYVNIDNTLNAGSFRIDDNLVKGYSGIYGIYALDSNSGDINLYKISSSIINSNILRFYLSNPNNIKNDNKISFYRSSGNGVAESPITDGLNIAKFEVEYRIGGSTTQSKSFLEVKADVDGADYNFETLYRGSDGTSFTIDKNSEIQIEKNVYSSKNINVTGNISANYFKGDGSLLDNLPSADLSSYLQNGTDANFGELDVTGTITAEQLTSTDDITASGTITAEQLTSTDDINMAGKLTNVMSANDLTGLLITSTPLTTGGTSSTIYLNREVAQASSNTGYTSYGIYNKLENSHAMIGGGFIATSTNNALYSYIKADGAHSFAGEFGMTGWNEANYNIWAGAFRSGTLLSSGDIKNYGMKGGGSFTHSFNAVGGTLNTHNYGLQYDISDSTNVVAGTHNINNYGIHINLNSASGSRATNGVNYGLYFQGVSGADDNYAIWDASGANWILDGDNQKIIIGEGQDREDYWDGTNAIINTTTGNLVIYNNSGYGTLVYGTLLQGSKLFDKSEGTALSKYKDVSNYYDKEGHINHSSHYAYTKKLVTDKNRPVTILKNMSINNQTAFYNETIYPYQKLGDFIDTSEIIATNEQAVYELREEIQLLKDRLFALESETSIKSITGLTDPIRPSVPGVIIDVH